MPSIRRRSEATEVYSDAPDPSHRANKRRRLSTEPPGSDSDDISSLYADAGPSAPQQTGTTSSDRRNLISTQADFDTLVDGQSDDEADQRREAKARNAIQDELEQQISGNQERQCGIIESVECQNFMCHKHLTIPLGPLINFIVGHNGSGKSAVLTAITLCLGGKATSTNRGQSLKSFVKEGEENCVLKVKIKNQGQGSFKPDQYGISITVERHFSVHGSSSFKIKSDTGRVVQTKRAELDELTDFYALQLDNPVNVLTQDQSRQFLNNSTASDKYRFFIRGVQLEQLNNDYAVVFQSLSDINATLPDVKEACDAREKQMKEAQQKYERTKEQGRLRDKESVLTRQHAWAQVAEQEKDEAKAKQEVEDQKVEIERRKKLMDEMSQEYDRRHQAVTDIDAAYEQAVQDKASLEEEKQTKQKLVEKDHNDLAESQREQRNIHTNLQEAKKTRENRQRDVDQERERLEAMDNGSNAELVQTVNNLEEELERLRAELESHPTQLPKLMQDTEVAKLKSEDLRKAVFAKEQEIQGAKAKLQELQKRDKDSMAAYDRSLRDVLSGISREHRWRKKPVGPIGMHVKLNRPEWSPLLEKYFGGQLNNFVVTSKHDELILSEIIRRTRFRCSVLIGNDRHIDTTRHEPSADMQTIMRVLTIEDESVRNQLIINQNIEKVLLVRDRREAMSMSETSRQPVTIICFQDNNRLDGHLIVKSNTGSKMDPMRSERGRSRMATDNASQVRIQQDVIQALNAELHDLQTKSHEAMNRSRECQNALTRHDRRLRDLRGEEQQCSSDLDEAKLKLNDATTSDSPLDSYKEQLTEAEEELVNLERQLAECRAEIAQLQHGNRPNKDALDAASEVLQRHVEKIDKLERQKTKAAEARQKLLRRKNEAIASAQDAETELTRREEDAENHARNVASFINSATQICARVPVNHSVEALDGRIAEIQRQIVRAEREVGGDATVIARRKTEAEQAYDRQKSYYLELLSIKDILQKTIHDRSVRWRKFRSEISARARIQFQYLLAERGFHGRLLFHHEAKELDLKVQPDTRTGPNAARQTKTLSGGEKSFSTICLLLALWDAMGSPIRCLDEFDVFMDSVNRDQSMKMMVMAARRSVGRQFVLITPQSMGSLVGGESDIKVHLMVEPERRRNNTTLNEAGFTRS